MSVLASAQFDTIRSNWLIGGTLEFQYRSTAFDGVPNPTTQLSVGVSPYFAKRIHQNWWVGLSATYQKSIRQFRDTNGVINQDTRNTVFRLGVRARYLFNPTARLQISLDPSLTYEGTREQNRINSPQARERTGDFIRLGVDPQFAYLVNPRWAILTQVGGVSLFHGRNQTISNTATSGRTITDVGATFRLSSIFFGLEFRF